MHEIDFRCIKCGLQFRVPAEYAGRKMQCEGCGTKQFIPELQASEPAQKPIKQRKEVTQRPRKRPAGTKGRPVSKRANSTRNTVPAAPQTKKSPTPYILLILLLVAAGIIVYFIAGRRTNNKREITLTENSSEDQKTNNSPLSAEANESPAASAVIKPQKPLPTGVIRVSAEKSKKWNPYAMGGNTKFMMDHPFTSMPENIRNIQRLGIRTFRYPAGTAGNDWDWILGTKGHSKFRYPTSEISYLQKKTGVEVLWMLNMLNKDVKHNITGLKSAKKSGGRVKYIELGNEFYLKGDQGIHRKRFPKGCDYGEECVKWIIALKKVFPDAKFAVSDTMKMVGLSKTVSRKIKKARSMGKIDIQFEVAGGWSDQVAATCDLFDVHVIHHYSRALSAPGKTAPGPKGSKPTAEEMQAQWRLFHSPNMLKAFIGRAPDYWKTLTITNNLPADSEIWITEFGVSEYMGVMRHTWASSMAVANAIGTYIDDGRVERFCYANFLGGWVYKKDKDLKTKGLDRMPGNLTTIPGEMAPCGKVNMMFAEAMNGMTIVQPLIFSGNPMIASGGIVKPYPALKGWRFGKKSASSKAIIVNFSDKSLKIDTSLFGNEKLVIHQFGSSDPFKLFPRENMLRDRTVHAVDDTLALPPYSLTVLTGNMPPLPPPPVPGRIVRSLSQDTSINKRSPDKNFCLDAKLLINRDSYAVIKFNIDNKMPPNAFSRVSLVFHTTGKVAGKIEACTLHTELQSNHITWNSIKKKNGKIVAVGKPGKTAGTFEFDLTGYVKSPGRYALLIKTTSGKAQFASIESKTSPQLIFSSRH